jgi:hypothetical protein
LRGCSNQANIERIRAVRLVRRQAGRADDNRIALRSDRQREDSKQHNRHYDQNHNGGYEFAFTSLHFTYLTYIKPIRLANEHRLPTVPR